MFADSLCLNQESGCIRSELTQQSSIFLVCLIGWFVWVGFFFLVLVGLWGFFPWISCFLHLTTLFSCFLVGFFFCLCSTLSANAEEEGQNSMNKSLFLWQSSLIPKNNVCTCVYATEKNK